MMPKKQFAKAAKLASPAGRGSRRSSGHRGSGSCSQTPTRKVVLVVYDGVQSLDVSGPYEVFAAASRIAMLDATVDVAPYLLEVVGESEGFVQTDSGLRLGVDRGWRGLRGAVDTLLVAGGDPRAAMQNAPLLEWLGRMQGRTRRIGSVCSGTFVLAEAGLLEGRRVATHWRAAEMFRQSYPEVELDADALFVRDRELATSAGVTAGIDMALALVEEDLGSEIALAVARELVVFLKRSGGQSQFSALLAAQGGAESPLGDLAEWIALHPDADLSVEALASKVAMSPRNFARVFLKETGTTPAKFVEKARVDAVRRGLARRDLPLESIARDCGFSNGEHMRRTFQRHLGVAPSDYRRSFEAAGASAA